MGKTSAFIGPLVSSAIITASGNNDNYPFVFLFTLYVPPRTPFHLSQLIILTPGGRLPSGSLSTVFLYFVDVDKSRKECEEFIAAEAKREAFADAS